MDFPDWKGDRMTILLFFVVWFLVSLCLGIAIGGMIKAADEREGVAGSRLHPSPVFLKG
jgi:hypothetical protein